MTIYLIGGQGGAVQSAPVAPTLATLSLSTTSATAGSAFNATISGKTAGSTITASSSDGTALTVTGTALSGTFAAAGSPTVTLTETLAGATGSPKSTPVGVTVASGALKAIQMGSRFNQPGFNGYTPTLMGTNTGSNSRISSFNETGAAVSKVKVVYPNWYGNATNETATGNAITITAAVEYPAGTFNVVTFSASATGTVASGANLVSDEITLSTSIPAGGQFWVKTYVTVTSGNKWPPGYLISTGKGEAVDIGTATTDLTQGAITNSAGTRAYGPIGVVATAWSSGTPIQHSLCGFGDSKIMGSTASNTSNHQNTGWQGHACDGLAPYVNMGISGQQAKDSRDTGATMRRDAMVKMGITDVLCDYSVNDVANSAQTYASITANLNTLWTSLTALGLKVYHSTSEPSTTSTDGFVTAANQSPSPTPTGAFTGGASSLRSQVNAYIRSAPAPLTGFWEIADLIEVNGSNVLTRDGGLWISYNGGVGAASTHLSATYANSSTDGLHPSVLNTGGAGFGALYIQRDGAIPLVNAVLAT